MGSSSSSSSGDGAKLKCYNLLYLLWSVDQSSPYHFKLNFLVDLVHTTDEVECPVHHGMVKVEYLVRLSFLLLLQVSSSSSSEWH